MNRIKDDQLKRIEGLQKEADNSLVKAKILQKSINEVQAIIEILHYLNGIQWKEIWRMIKEEKRSGNPLANIIHSLDLEKQQATLIFNSTEIDKHEDQDDYLVDIEENIIVKIEIDLTLSAQSNIQKYFEIKKKTQDKEERTKDKAHEAIKNAEDQARRALLKARNEQREKITRKPYWFEKFDWFISSENYLIISGRNAQQNEELVKTYLGKRDIYVHSEMAGSASCIIKNPSLEEVSPLTINECGIWAICHSKAWDMKVVTNAFWVWGDQVSKTPQSGEYLVTGSFIIRGKKNYVNPQRLELGITIMFKLDDDSIANHLNERRNRSALETDDTASSTVDHKFKENTEEKLERIKQDKIEALEAQIQEDNIENTENQMIGIVEESELIEQPEEEQKSEIDATKDPIPEQTLNDQNDELSEGEGEGDDDENPQQDQIAEEPIKKQTPQLNKNKNQPKQANKKGQKVDMANLPRGKKSKLKKMKQKYGDQDDDDKAMMFELLGAKDVQNTTKKNKNKQETPQFFTGDKSGAKNEKGNNKKEKGGKQEKQQQDKKPKNNEVKQKQQVENFTKVEGQAKTEADEYEEIKQIIDDENLTVVHENVSKERN